MDNELLETFIFTNGSNTFQNCLKSVENQTFKTKITVIENKSLMECMNFCLTNCNSKFFIKIDDDMFLHQKAIEYFRDRLCDNLDIGMYACMLLDYRTRKPIQCIKAYNKIVSQNVGFVIDKRGKIDKAFHKKLRKNNNVILDRSVVAVHALRDLPSQLKYRQLWINQSGTSFDKFKLLDPCQACIHEEAVTEYEQYKYINQLKLHNRNNKFRFYIKKYEKATKQ